MMMNARQKWEWGLIMVTALWGWSFVAIHESLHFLSDSAFNAYRFLSAAVILAFVLLIGKYQIARQDAVGGVVAGLALYAALFFQTKGIGLTSASNASFITGLAVVFTPFFMWLFLKSVPTKQQVMGAVFATTGLALLTLKGLSIHLGDILVLLCAVFFAVHIIILSKVSKKADVFALSFVQIVTVGLCSLAQSFLFREFSMPTNMAVWYAILIIGIFGTAVGFFVQTKAQVESSPNRIALIIVLEPVFGGIFGYFLAHDRLTIQNWIGAFLILMGMLATEWQVKSKK